eukprot:2329478-Pyramimonas_sp.AAC.1
MTPGARARRAKATAREPGGPAVARQMISKNPGDAELRTRPGGARPTARGLPLQVPRQPRDRPRPEASGWARPGALRRAPRGAARR